MLDPVSPLPAFMALLAAAATARLLSGRIGLPPSMGRFVAIDGLRGYLALFVFLHHGCMWYFYLRSGKFDVPPSNLYTNFGQVGVSLFFMITGFLFFTKLIEAKAAGIDWRQLYASRIMRLTPLYFFFMLLFFLLAAYMSGGKPNKPPAELGLDALKWLCFRFFGAPDPNGVRDIAGTVAGITWTLPFEWSFYAALPVLALTTRRTWSPRASAMALFLAVILLVGAAVLNPFFAYLLPFLSGIVAAVLNRSDAFRRMATRKLSGGVALACAGIALTAFSNAYNAPPLALLTIAFCLVACGNTLFGMLTMPVSRLLGEISYSIYLLHSFTLFVVFNFLVGLPKAQMLSSTAHWGVIIGTTPLLIVFCAITFRCIEQPGMRRTPQLAGLLRKQ